MTTENLSALCTALERRIRGLKRNILGILKDGEDALFDPDKVPIFKAKLSVAQADWTRFQNAWDERDSVQVSMPDPNAWPDDQWLKDYSKTRKEICEAAAVLVRIEQKTAEQARQSLMPQHSEGNTTFIQGVSDGHLPKIQIPTFSGDLLQWSHFKDTFLSMVHEEPSLTNIKKFHYLRSALKGEPATLLSRIPIGEQSYIQAWDKLKKTYDNPRVLASLYVQRIIECDAKSQKTEALRYESFLNGVADGIEGFRSLAIEDGTDFLLSALAIRALDQNTRNQLELSIKSSNQAPTADEVVEFVRKRMNALKLSRDTLTAQSFSTSTSSHHNMRTYPNRQAAKYNGVNLYASNNDCRESTSPPTFKPGLSGKKKSSGRTRGNNIQNGATGPTGSTIPVVCPFCKSNHLLPYCLEFCNLPPERRIAFVEGWIGCRNCLRADHKVAACTSKWSCRFCRQRHHSIIHIGDNSIGNGSLQAQPPKQGNFIGFGTLPSPKTMSVVMLGTVQLLIKDWRNGFHCARAVLDSGSTHTFISEALARRIGVPIQSYDTCITGLGGSVLTKPLGTIICSLRPYQALEEVQCQAIVINQVSSSIPHMKIEERVYNSLAAIDLADRSFDSPGPIDILIGADIYPLVVTGAPCKSAVPDLSLLPTLFGSAVIGKISNVSTSQTTVFFTETNSSIESQLKAFWELEEPIAVDRQHPDDRHCEDHFKRTFTRTPEGRYTVRLPMKHSSQAPGSNREMAYRRFLSLEQKFKRSSDMADHYSHFMKEYEDLGHMSLTKSVSSYLIPHHGIWQGDKIRVVFDASCTSDNGVSLNDILFPGPKLQSDICQVLTRFRLYAIPLKADLVKMYRQILIHPEDRHLQHVVWRETPDAPLLEFELNTVTYGVRSSPFHALRVLSQLVEDEGIHFPLAARRIKKEMFVDDIATGADTIEEVVALKESLCGLFMKGGFTLGKWASTESSLIPDIDETTAEPIIIQPVDESSRDVVKILGLVWDPKIDAFSYHISPPAHSGITKRLILSSIAKIFDPLGFVSPVVFLAKVLMQEIWKAELGWDDVLPVHLSESWNSLVSEWAHFSTITIPRYATEVNATRQLIGFCDASNKGYAAAVYLRSTDPSGKVKVSLLKAKTKVAPLKFVSIARLELCGALLLSQLLSSMALDDWSLSDAKCFTDSSNVLAWLRLPTHALRVFEANRVSQILSTTSLACWKYVNSEDNPCDLASRGCTPSRIMDEDVWWNGPLWLHRPEHEWPTPFSMANSATVLMSLPPAPPKENDDEWLKRFSSISTLIPTVVRMLRFLEVRKKIRAPLNRPITAEEYNNAKMRVIRCVQLCHLPAELHCSGATIPKAFQQLSPFIDSQGIIRVGGRLQNAPLDFSTRHPILIPTNSHLASLLIRDIHERNFHAGPVLVLALLRNSYWIPKAGKAIRKWVHSCVHCRKLKAKPVIPLMSPLPKDRVTQSRPFNRVGVDFAGPFSIKESMRRNASLGKAYLCVFVCLVTKAIHLEAVTSLSTAAFLASFGRFTSRRGLPSVVWSDNGTNFVGASRFMKDVYAFWAREEKPLTETLASSGVDWKFIPPRAPHFGGIWEAGVKSVKRLLISTVGKQPYTFEELTTAFTRIEGLLNSRPLCALTDDVHDFNFLTPGHFLIGAPISSLPEPSGPQLIRTASNRWCTMQAQIANLWERWRREYLHTLQQRKKWTKNVPNINVGDLVVLLEKRSIVGQWPVARVVETHPGGDGVTRTVTVRTPSGGSFVRAVASVIPLFLNASEEEGES